MKRLIVFVFLAGVFASSVPAQVPIVQVYLDSELLMIHSVCGTYNTIDTLYVVASNFTPPIVDIEYRIDTHGNFLIVQDLLPNGYISDGYSWSGIRLSFGGPVDASAKVVVERIVGVWTCESCSGGVVYFQVEPHPDTGKIQATGWPDLMKIEATGGPNDLCGALPVEPSTWGRIKALYR